MGSEWRTGPRLVGRATERDAALGAVRQAGAATGHVLVIEGEAGIGKTRLIDDVVASADQAGLRVARGAGHELETDLPLAPLLDALDVRSLRDDALRAATASASRGEDSPFSMVLGEDGAQRRLRAVELLIELVVASCDRGPMALVIDDLHWADEPTLATLGRLVRKLPHLPLLLLLAMRPYPRTTALRALLESLGSVPRTTIALTALNDDALGDLAADVLGDAPGPNLAARIRGTGGNPLYLLELLRALDEDGSLRVTRHGIDVATTELPPSLRATLLQRFATLPNATLRLLRCAAVLGPSFHPTALAAMTERPGPSVVHDLEPAIACGLVVEAGDALAFAHDLVHEALYGDLPEPVRGTLHATAARALSAAGFPTLEVAPHLLRGALGPDPETVEALRAAAGDLQPLAPGASVDLLQRAVHLLDRSHPVQDDVRAELAMACAWAGRRLEAAELTRRLLADLPAGRARRSALLVRWLTTGHGGGDPSQAEALMQAATEPDATDAERGRLLLATASNLLARGDVHEAERVAQRGTDAAARAGDVLAHCSGLALRAMAAQLAGDIRTAVGSARRAVEVARRSRDDHALAIAPELTFGMIAGNEPDLADEAIAVVQQGLERAERHGLVAQEMSLRQLLGVNLYRAGRWDEATVELETVVLRHREIGGHPSEIVNAAARLVRLAVHRDDLPAARAWMEEAGAGPPEQIPHGMPVHVTWTGAPWGSSVHVAIAGAELLEAEGRPEEALQRLDEAVRSLGPDARPAAETVAARGRIRLALKLGREGDARGWLNSAADRPKVAMADVVVPWMRALLDGDRGALLATVDRVRTVGSPLAEDLPQMLEDAAGLSSDEREVAELLGEARDRWERLGATRDVARVDAGLRRLGVRRGVRGPRQRPTTGWAALTEAEWRLLPIVAEGLTYRQVGERLFISRRTVETHVANIFRKLGVSNRNDLIEAYTKAQREAGS